MSEAEVDQSLRLSRVDGDEVLVTGEFIMLLFVLILFLIMKVLIVTNCFLRYD